jgi:hypothetical protein
VASVSSTRCALHAVDGCAECPPRLLPPPTVDEVETVDAADLADERYCYEQRDFMIGLAKGQQERREDNESQDRIGAATIAKLMDGALKWHRAGREVRAARRELEHDRMLIEHEREMAGIGRRAH